jgi:hypothetical protein
MRRSVYSSQNSPDDNKNDGTGGLPQDRQPRSPSPSDNPPPRLTEQQMRVQREIEDQIYRENRVRFAGPSNGEAGGTERQLEGFRRVKRRIDPDGVNGEGGGFAGARGSARTAELIKSGAPLDEIIPPQNNNSNVDAPPQGVDRPLPPIVPGALMREERVAVPANTENLDVTSFFQRRFNEAFANQNPEPEQLTTEHQAGQQRAVEAQQRAVEAQQRASNLQRQAALTRPASQIIEPQVGQQPQNRSATPEQFPIHPHVDRSNFPGGQPRGGKSPER